MVSVEYSEALSEIDDIFKHLDNDVMNKIPQKFKNFVSSNKSKTYNPTFDHSKRLNELPLKDKTRAILSVIYMNFLCNEEEKKAYTQKLNENSAKREQELKEKYNPDNLFKNKPQEIKKEQQVTENVVAITEYKEGFFTKLFNSLKMFFKSK